VLEISFGFFDEDDIVRLKDKEGEAPAEPSTLNKFGAQKKNFVIKPLAEASGMVLEHILSDLPTCPSAEISFGGR